MHEVGGHPEDAQVGSPVSAGWAQTAPTRDLIAALAASEEDLRQGSPDAQRRRRLVARQAVIIRELRRRRTQWRQQ